ncbi:Mut7-C RNAse domain-containing protein [Methylomicrobium lacus]|uniref:Mut7-C RNAse domain-containing protein n=1 Tax=Methylomicrobium lacus TaxID=136992 RepID=UPI0035A99C53
MKRRPQEPPTCRFENSAEFRFYEELNDFLRPQQRKQTLAYRFNGNPGIKDPIEVFGVPHTEVDLIVVNGESVGFDYRLKNGDRVAVYPVFESFDISPIIKLRAAPLRHTAFVVDVNLGKLARLLRLFGFDTLFTNALTDAEIAAISAEQQRIVLTRDRRLLFAKAITHGYWVRAVEPLRQLAEVVRRFDLADQLRPFCRCTACNGLIEAVEKQAVLDLLEPKTKRYYERFYRCPTCGKVYWEGSHIDHMRQRFAGYLQGKAT